MGDEGSPASLFLVPTGDVGRENEAGELGSEGDGTTGEGREAKMVLLLGLRGMGWPSDRGERTLEGELEREEEASCDSGEGTAVGDKWLLDCGISKSRSGRGEGAKVLDADSRSCCKRGKAAGRKGFPEQPEARLVQCREDENARRRKQEIKQQIGESRN